MNNIDIAVNMVEPLHRDYFNQFEVITKRKLTEFDRRNLAFVIFKITRKIDGSTVYIVADVVRLNEITDVIKRPPKLPLLYASLKNDIAHVSLIIRNAQYVVHRMLDENNPNMDHPVFSAVPVSQLNILAKALTCRSTEQMEVLVNDWLNNNSLGSLYDELENPDA